MHGLRADSRAGMALFLEQQAVIMPEETFFFWEGRAFSYQQVNERVEAVARGLIHCGVRPGERVVVLFAVAATESGAGVRGGSGAGPSYACKSVSSTIGTDGTATIDFTS